MTAEEKKEMDRLRAEVERLTAMNVSLAAASERLLERNVDLYERMDAQHEDVLSAIRETGDLSKETEEALKAALKSYTEDFLKQNSDEE